ncbi:hypothetical protein Tco_1443387, partial [Tanacetum coccineum]
MPSIPSPELTISYLNDLDFFKEFENAFPAVVYNDAQTSKSDLLTEPILSPQHNDEFDLNDETLVSEYDEEEQNILYFNDLFPFNIIHPDDLKLKKDNDNNKIDIIQSSEDMAPLPPREQRHPLLRYQGLEYTDADIEDFEMRLTRIYKRESIGMLRFGQAILDLDTPGALQFLLGGARRRMSWSARQIPDKGDLRDYWIGISSAGDFLSTAPSYTAPEKVTVTDLFYLRGMDVGSVNIPYLLARYLRLFVVGRKSGAHISGGQFVARLAEYFRLLTVEILQGLTVIASALPVIDMAKLVRLQICVEIDDTWAWVALGPERQPDAAAGAPRVAQD